MQPTPPMNPSRDWRRGVTQAEAITRWCLEHPDEAPPGEAVDFIILNSIVSPNAKRE